MRSPFIASELSCSGEHTTRRTTIEKFSSTCAFSGYPNEVEKVSSFDSFARRFAPA
jgi:hypothetical protein